MTLVLVPQIVPTPPGQPKGGTNCNPCAGATCVIHATGGTARPDGAAVRLLCREEDGSQDKSGGTNLRQVADAIDRGWDVEMDVRTPDDYAVFRARMKREPNTAASVSFSYSALVGTSAYASRTGFRGNHQGVVRWVGTKGAEWELVEPLADGNDVPLAPVRVSDAVLRKATGALVLTARVNGKKVSWPLGVGKVYVGYVQGPAAPVPTKHSIRLQSGSIHVYSVQGGVAIARTSRQFAKKTSAPCSAPTWIPYPTVGSRRRRLVRVTTGPLAGQYVEPGRAHVELVA